MKSKLIVNFKSKDALPCFACKECIINHSSKYIIILHSLGWQSLSAIILCSQISMTKCRITSYYDYYYRTDQSMAVSQFHMRQSFAEDWGFHRDSLATVGVCHNTLWVSTNQTVFVEVQCNTAASAIIYEFHSKFCTLGTYTSICRQDNLCGSILSLHGGRSGLEVQEEDYS